MARTYRPVPVALAGVVALVLALAGCAPLGVGAAAPVPTATGGPVTLRGVAASYRAGDTIRATLQNESGQAIAFPDMRSMCSELELERCDGSDWSFARPCGQLRHGSTNTLAAGQSETIELPLPPDLLGGVYRLTLRYGPYDAVATQVTVIHSAGFAVT